MEEGLKEKPTEFERKRKIPKRLEEGLKAIGQRGLLILFIPTVVRFSLVAFYDSQDIDEQSDSEESHTTTTPRLPKAFQQKSYYNKLPYSSQSTPRRKFQHESTKSTRSSSTASENKITFNEDEYTRITTPRQDVLFKKGYLSKPKNYQTQTSTGTSTSTTSTGNSTGNGTPDHQSTDLEYDSQFVFPNGFVDQNGIYYVNSFESYPLMLFNPPTYYPEFSNSKSKRYSTGSLTESTSPNNEEATSQDLSGGEASNNVSDYSSHHSVYNMVYPGYYVNGVCPNQEVEVGQYPSDQTRRIKKRRRRKTSRSQVNNHDESSECSEDEDTDSVEPAESEISPTSPALSSQIDSPAIEEVTQNDNHVQEKEDPAAEISSEIPNPTEVCADNKSSSDSVKPPKYDLKPDAEEFVPRAYRTPEIPLSPVQFIKVPPNFLPIPVVPFNGQINPAFISPGAIPVNFLPPDPKFFPPNYVNFVPGQPKNEETSEKIKEIKEGLPVNQQSKVCDNSNTAKEEELPSRIEKFVEKAMSNGKTIDIATIVSKLEEAAKEQEENDEEKTKSPNSEYSPKKKPFRTNHKYKNNYKRNFYNSPRNSPQRQNGEVTDSYVTETNENKHIFNDIQTETQTDTKFAKDSPERFKQNWKSYQSQNSSSKWHPNVNRTSQQIPRLQTNRETAQTPKNYSNTVKTNPVSKKSQPELKTRSVPSSPRVCPPLLPNQWISVSSRKKRKSKNIDDGEASLEDTTTLEEDKDQFESYDVSMLIDVIPSSTIEEESIKVEILEENVGNIINTIAQSESTNLQNNCLTPDIRSVTEIENELIIKELVAQEVTKSVAADIEDSDCKDLKTEGTHAEDTKTADAQHITTEDIKLEDSKSEEIPDIQIETENMDNIVEEIKSAKKKSKKSNQKSLTKRVIITDIDLSEKCEEVKTPIKKVVKKIEKPKVMPEIKVEQVENPPITESEITIEEPEDIDRKKNKKKKKKASKGAANSLFNSAASLSTADDAYESLLDASLTLETDKTNDEISVELDKMIHKGMYSSLEEKIKTLNINENDGFFKSVFSNVPISGRSEAGGYLKTPDFTKIPLFKSDPVSEDQSLESKKTNAELPASDSSKISLENPDLTAALPEQIETTNEESKSLYPITEAVKEWMCRTRETTPDVEIFKSPSTIYKEFCESATNSDTDLCNSRNLSDELSCGIDDDEITIFTTEDTEKLVEESNDDLLEYWEDLKTEESQKSSAEDGNEEELEVYDSKYGKNEDYLKLQEEVYDKVKNIKYPKHGNLPYRAICCNVM